MGTTDLWIKRDDCSGLALGGNKVRKLEFLLGEALAQGAEEVLTVGALQSNHARQTAAACAKLGLKCHLVLLKSVEMSGDLYEQGGNVLLDRLFGAEVYVSSDYDDVFECILSVEQKAREDGKKIYQIPPGGSTAVGSLGFVQAVEELAGQMKELPDRIVLAASTGGTLAGIVVGLSKLGCRVPLDAIMVYEPSERFHPQFEKLVKELCDAVETPMPDLDLVSAVDGYLGKGYGQPTLEMSEAVMLAARNDGILLDPVYTGKAMAALIDRYRSGTYEADERILFWHTGGMPALFAYGALAPDQ